MKSSSATKVFYDLRPAKQIERRMILDALQILMASGFPIRDYQYTGMGSIYFVDFILFHKLLGIRRMLSAEMDTTIEDRVTFNKPYKDVEVKMCQVGDVIPDLDPDLKHIVWLDYDSRLSRSIREDVESAAYRLSPGSILLVTVNATPPPRPQGTPEESFAFLQEQVGDYFEPNWTPSDFGRSQLPYVNAHLLLKIIRSGVAPRPAVEFFPLFQFSYSDGTPMVTIGGMIGTGVEKRKLDACDFSGAAYIRRSHSVDLFEIHVPRLTRRERQVLDAGMLADENWTPREFKLDPEDLAAYRQIYRYYPAFGELLV